MEPNQKERYIPINEDLSILSRDDGLTFGTDAYLLSAFVKQVKCGKAADLGTGTGVLSLFGAARRGFQSVDAWEIQPVYADLAARNADLNHLGDKIHVRLGDIRNIPTQDYQTCDAVWSNPPYMPLNSGFSNKTEEMDIARRERNGTICDFASAASLLLKTGGHAYFVYRPDRMTDLLSALRNVHLEPKRLVLVYPTLQDGPSLILVDAKKDAAPSLTISRPLIIYSEPSRYTPDMTRVYDTFSLDFLFER